MFDLTVMLRVEHVVDSREADVLVAAAVARDEVTVEQLVVVRPFPALSVARLHVAQIRVGIRLEDWTQRRSQQEATALRRLLNAMSEQGTQTSPNKTNRQLAP